MELLIFTAVVYCSFFIGNPPTVSPETTVVVSPLTPDGKRVDFRRRYIDSQDAWLGPVSENGYRLILQTLGPRALDQSQLAYSVRWEDFPNDHQSYEWYHGDWTKQCEKFHLNPATKPLFINRLDLTQYLRVHGITGTEKIPDSGSPEALKYGTVRNDYRKVPARVSIETCMDVYRHFFQSPWTAKEFPLADRKRRSLRHF